MKIKVKYLTQARKATGVSEETINIKDRITIQDCIKNILCDKHKKLGEYIIDDAGDIRKLALVFVGDKRADFDIPMELNDGDDMSIMLPIMGG